MAKCKRCGEPADWVFTENGWRLYNGAQPHFCTLAVSGPVKAPRPPRKQKKNKGAWLQWFGPVSERTEAVLMEPAPDPDTPAGLYAENPHKHWSTL